ncbi:hypothetical protein BOTCAL_0522g00010 [Botryotinia calthae]|uniref:Secreted protein n=1 Tax=Botryotinia calthae TaxID=38488 RepID=A0A4Y8CMK0_9HELO|nr:hypothetical protein BOTCAL_0522g00010 [Botryotinia calthae]
MSQLLVVITLVVFAVVGVLEHRGAGFDGGDGDREGGTAASRDNGIATAGGADGASEGGDSGDIGLARTLPLEG